MTKTVSVFIPAYNEENNIKQLILQILSQNQKNFVLEKILIVSDASTDHTAEEIQSIKSPLIELAENDKRMGKWFGFTIAQKRLSSELIISIDADTTIKDEEMFSKIINEIKDEDLVSVRQFPKKPEKMLEKIIYSGVKTSLQYYEENDSQMYLCNGRFILTTEHFFKSIQWFPMFGTDVYTYINLASQGKKFRYIKDITIYYNLPKNIRDYIKQSSRAFYIKEQFEDKLGKNVNKLFKPINKKFIAKILLKQLITNPFSIISYILLKLTSRFLYKKINQKPLWDIAKSTK